MNNIFIIHKVRKFIYSTQIYGYCIMMLFYLIFLILIQYNTSISVSQKSISLIMIICYYIAILVYITIFTTLYTVRRKWQNDRRLAFCFLGHYFCFWNPWAIPPQRRIRLPYKDWWSLPSLGLVVWYCCHCHCHYRRRRCCCHHLPLPLLLQLLFVVVTVTKLVWWHRICLRQLLHLR